MFNQKSVNLQYNMLVRWADGTNNSSTKCLTFQVFFFIIFYRLSKPFIFIYEKINWKGFYKEFCKILWKKNTWNKRCWVDESFVPSAQQTSILYCRLTDFRLAWQCTLIHFHQLLSGSDFLWLKWTLKFFSWKNLQKNPSKGILNILLDKKVKMQECAVPNAWSDRP